MKKNILKVLSILALISITIFSVLKVNVLGSDSVSSDIVLSSISLNCTSSNDNLLLTWNYVSSNNTDPQVKIKLVNMSDNFSKIYYGYLSKKTYNFEGTDNKDTYYADIKINSSSYSYVSSNVLNSSNCLSSTPPVTNTQSQTPTVSSTSSMQKTPTPTISSTPITTTTPSPVVSKTTSSFITTQNGQFYVNSNPIRLLGYTDYRFTANSINSCGGIMSDSDVSNMLDQIKTYSKGNVVRAWFFQSYIGSNDNWSSFDRLITLAQQKGMYVVPTLENQWGDCETSGYKTLSWYQNGYKQVANGDSTSFYDYVTKVVSRYANNPAIAFWQIMNEAEARDSQNGTCNEANAMNALNSFSSTIAQEIKGIDHNHLVNLGTMGSGQCGTVGSNYIGAQSSPNLDVLEYHDYNADNIAMPGDAYNGLQARINEAKQVSKPIFIGEAGIKGNVQSDGTESGAINQTSINMRSGDFNAKMDAQFNAGIAGYLIWSKAPNATDIYGIGPSDPTEAVMAKYSI